MKKLLMALSLAFFGTAAFAQGRSVTLTAVDTLNPAATTYNFYRAPGQCSGTPPFAKLNVGGSTVKTVVDLNVTPGAYCYTVTATLAAVETSVGNPTAFAAVGPVAPQQLNISIALLEGPVVSFGRTVIVPADDTCLGSAQV